jgi:hypothetical protein
LGERHTLAGAFLDYIPHQPLGLHHNPNETIVFTDDTDQGVFRESTSNSRVTFFDLIAQHRIRRTSSLTPQERL